MLMGSDIEDLVEVTEVVDDFPAWVLDPAQERDPTQSNSGNIRRPLAHITSNEIINDKKEVGRGKWSGLRGVKGRT